MENFRKRNQRITLCIIVFISIAFLCRILVNFSFYSSIFGLVRSVIYIGLFIAWGVSLHQRILQTQVRRYLDVISMLMVFWIVLRSIRYFFILDLTIARQIWYWFYFPMVFIPFLTLFIASSLGKSENYRLPGWKNLFYILATALLLMVLTNDMHQLVFRFPNDDMSVWEKEYQHNIGYFIVAGWMAICSLAAIIIMSTKCRIPNSRKVLIQPFIPFGLCIIYTILYILEFPLLQMIAGDMTIVLCLLFAAIYESCIKCGLIQSNTKYVAFFPVVTDVAAHITDRAYTVYYSSMNAVPIPVEQMRAAEKKPVLLENGQRLHNMAINGGHVVWTEDVSSLLEMHQKLEDLQEELQERNDLLRYEYDREKERKIIEEQNRLYDILQQKTQTQLDAISRLVTAYQSAIDKESREYILAKIVVLGSFIKRRKDLILSADTMPIIPQSKLSSALKESFHALSRMNIKGSFFVDTGKEYLEGEILTLAYDFIEDVIETNLDDLRQINVQVRPVKGILRISILVDCDANFDDLTRKYPQVRIEADCDGINLVLPLEGGELR